MHSDDDSTLLLINELFTWLAIQEHKFDNDEDNIDFDGLQERLQKILTTMNQPIATSQAAKDLQQIYVILDRLNSKIIARKQEATAYMERLNHSTNSIASYVRTSLLGKTETTG